MDDDLQPVVPPHHAHHAHPPQSMTSFPPVYYSKNGFIHMDFDNLIHQSAAGSSSSSSSPAVTPAGAQAGSSSSASSTYKSLGAKKSRDPSFVFSSSLAGGDDDMMSFDNPLCRRDSVKVAASDNKINLEQGVVVVVGAGAAEYENLPNSSVA